MNIQQRKAFWSKRKGDRQRFVGQADSFKMLDKALKANGERHIAHSHGEETHLLRYNEYDYIVEDKSMLLFDGKPQVITRHHSPDYRQNFGRQAQRKRRAALQGNPHLLRSKKYKKYKA